MNLDTGVIRQSPAVEVTRTKADDGLRYTGWTVPIYEAIDGKIYHRELIEHEF